PAGLPAHGRAVPALRPADQADRHRRPFHAFLLVVPAAQRQGPGERDEDPSRRGRRPQTGGAALDGAGGGRDRRPHAGRSRPRGGSRQDRANATGCGHAPSRRAILGGSVLGGSIVGVSILRLAGVTREVGTFVILDRIDASIALGDRIGLVGPNGAGKTTLLRIAAGLDEADGGKVTRKRDLTIGMLAQEAHLDAAFMAAPDVRTAVRHGAAALESMAVELEAMEHAGRAAEPAYETLQHRFEALGG